MRHRSILLIVTFLLAACGTMGRGLTVRDAWARPAGGGTNTAIYLTIRNEADGDELLSAYAEGAAETQLHRSIIDDEGTVHMERQSAVELPAGETVHFEPGGLHIMLVDLEDDLQEDDTVPLHLTFRDHEPLTLSVPVRSP